MAVLGRTEGRGFAPVDAGFCAEASRWITGGSERGFASESCFEGKGLQGRPKTPRTLRLNDRGPTKDWDL